MNIGLVVDDIKETRNWMGDILYSAFPDIQIRKEASVFDAKQAIHNHYFSIAIVDLGLPDGNGCEIIHTLKQSSPDCFIVVATIYDDESHLFNALKAGANGYLIKDLPRNIFIQKLKGILAGEPPLSPCIARKMLRYFAMEHPNTITAHTTQNVKLSPREIDVLTLVAKGYSRKEIARLLDLSINTVSRYIKGAYSRLNISSKAEAAIEACRLGLIDSKNIH